MNEPVRFVCSACAEESGHWGTVPPFVYGEDFDRMKSDRDRLAAELEAAKDGGALSMDQWMHRALKAEAELSSARAALEQEQARWAWYVENMRNMERYHDFGYLDPTMDEVRAAIDAKRAASSAGAQYATGTDFRCPKCKGIGPCSECNPDPRAGLTVSPARQEE